MMFRRSSSCLTLVVRQQQQRQNRNSRALSSLTSSRWQPQQHRGLFSTTNNVSSPTGVTRSAAVPPPPGPVLFFGRPRPHQRRQSSAARFSAFASSTTVDDGERPKEDDDDADDDKEEEEEVTAKQEEESLPLPPPPPPPPPRPTRPWLDPNLNLNARTEQLLKSPQLHPSAHRDVSPLLRELCRKNTLQGMQQATDVVERLVVEKKRLYEDSGDNSDSDSNSNKLVSIPNHKWDILMYGWAVLAPEHRVAQVRMQELLRRVTEEAEWDEERHHEDSPRLLSLPTVDIYNTYLRGLANAARSSRSAPVRAIAALEEMTNNCHRAWYCRPNTKSYMHAIVACSNSRHPDAGQLAVGVLRMMQEAHRQEKITYQDQYGVPYSTDAPETNKRKITTPDVMAYTAVMKAIVSSQRDAHLALDLLQELLDASNDDESRYLKEQMDVRVFVAAISAFARMVQNEQHSQATRLDYAEQAEKVLCKAIEFVNNTTESESNHPTSTIPTDGEGEEAEAARVADATAKSNAFGNNSLLVAFNTCLDAWSRAYAPEAPIQCERILRTMIAGGNLDGDGVGGATPNARTSVVVVVPAPDTVSFNSCLFAWSRANKFHADAASKAVALLDWQHELSSDSSSSGGGGFHQQSLVPDYQSYTLAILARAHSKSDANEHFGKIREARRLLDTMLKHLQTGRVKPSGNPSAPFSAVLTAAAKSSPAAAAPQKRPQQQQHAEDADHEEELGSSDGDGVGDDFFNSEVETENDAYSLALRTYQEVVDDAYQIGTKPDHHFFSAMLRCIAVHCDERSAERESMARGVFETACQEGQAGRLVIDGLAAALGRDAVRSMQPHQMPRFYSRNVPASFRVSGKKKPTRRRRGRSP